MNGKRRRCRVCSLFVLVPLAPGCRDSPDRQVPCRICISESNFSASVSLLKARIILTLRRIRQCTGTLNNAFLELLQAVGDTCGCFDSDLAFANQRVARHCRPVLVPKSSKALLE